MSRGVTAKPTNIINFSNKNHRKYNTHLSALADFSAHDKTLQKTKNAILLVKK